MGEIPKVADVRAATLVSPGAAAPLSGRRPRDDAKALFPEKKQARASTSEDAVAINTLQDTLYAERSRALLVVLQGLDTAGKSGTIRAVFNRTGPVGVRVTAFGPPSKAELARDYLWRVHEAVPPRGFIGVFDRSHYEDVLVVRVRSLAPADAVAQRYDQINAFERHLHENGTQILKCWLHISKDEQKERLQARLDDPAKHWKFNPRDLDDRALWEDYQAAADLMLSRCSTDHAPWHVIPSDSKTRRNAIIARLVRGALEEMAPQYPEPEWDPGDFKIR